MSTMDYDELPTTLEELTAVSASNTENLPATSQVVAAALRAAGVEPAIQELPDSARTAADAARALECPVAAIANSLVFVCDDAPLLIMTSGANRVDTDAVAARMGTGPILRAKPDVVRAATGQAIGGVAPVGHPAPITTVVDETLAEQSTIWAAGGTPHTLFPTTYDDLVAMTEGRPLRVTS